MKSSKATPRNAGQTKASINPGAVHLPHADATADLLRDVIEPGQAAGQVRPELDPDLTAHLLLDVCLGQLYRWAANGGSFWGHLEPAIALILDALRPTREPSR